MKTAVEWMVEKLFKPMDNPPIENVSDIIKQAKDLEKQQIIEAYKNGYSDSDNTFELNKEYYNETFNK